MLKQPRIDQGVQKRPLPCQREIPTREVADRRQTGALRDHACHAKMHRCRVTARGVVPQQLPRPTDAPYLLSNVPTLFY
jgi:hypothetical protein